MHCVVVGNHPIGRVPQPIYSPPCRANLLVIQRLTKKNDMAFIDPAQSKKRDGAGQGQEPGARASQASRAHHPGWASRLAGKELPSTEYLSTSARLSLGGKPGHTKRDVEYRQPAPATTLPGDALPPATIGQGRDE
jgi:hypothetical protein